jgi:hypothetical protein
VFPSSSAVSSGATSTNSATYAGQLPALLTSAALQRAQAHCSSWSQLGPADSLTLSGWENASSEADVAAGIATVHTFYPLKVVTKESIGANSLAASSAFCTPAASSSSSFSGNGAVDGCEWDALVVGVVRRTLATSAPHNVADSYEINAISAGRVKPCVCIVRYSPSGTSVTAQKGGKHISSDGAIPAFTACYTNFRDAAYWFQSAAPVPAVGPTAASGGTVSMFADMIAPAASSTAAAAASAAAPSPLNACVLALSQSGKQVQVLSARNAVVTSTASMDLGAEMGEIWTSPIGNITSLLIYYNIFFESVYLLLYLLHIVSRCSQCSCVCHSQSIYVSGSVVCGVSNVVRNPTSAHCRRLPKSRFFCHCLLECSFQNNKSGAQPQRRHSCRHV